MVKRGGVFKRLETDAEFLPRVVAKAMFVPLVSSAGVALDDFSWKYRVQRRIIEASCD